MRDAAAIAAALGRGTEAQADGRELAVSPPELVGVLAALKALGDFMLLDIDAVDRPEGFDVAYRLLDRGGEGSDGIYTLKVRANKADPRLPSVMSVWRAADVMEREVWDLMGVVFEGRGGLKRILCKDEFEGHPLRKDFVLAQTPRFPVPCPNRPAGVAEGGSR